MFDAAYHQAAGLQGFMPQSALRVLAVASQENAAQGFETLWQICASLQRMGHPVVVLDGTAHESEKSPGLLHLLQSTECVDMNVGAGGSSLAVIPAAKGLHQASVKALHRQEPPLQDFVPFFRSYSLMVLYAPAATLGPLLSQTTTVPLIVMGTGSQGIVSSYRSLKSIAVHTGQPSMVAALLGSDMPRERQQAHAALQTLQQCAKRHLGGPIRTTIISTQKSQDLQRLALQLLENAGTISELLTPAPQSNWTGIPAHFVRSH